MNQWKKMFCLVLALAMLMLAGCQDSGNGRKSRKDRDDEDDAPKQTGAVEVEYRIMDGIDLLRQAGIVCEKIEA